MIVTPPSVSEVTGHAAQMYENDLATEGFVLGYNRAMAINPDAHEAFEALIRTIVPSIGIGVYEAATLGAARAIGSTHCKLAHGRRSVRMGVVDEAGLAAFATGDDSAFTPEEQAVIRFAEKMSTDAAAMTDADAQELRDLGFSDRQIVDIVLAAGARNYFSRALLALGVPTDEMPGLDPAIAAALVDAPRSAQSQPR